MNVATFELTLALPIDKAPLSAVIEYLTKTMKIPESHVIAVGRSGSTCDCGFILPLWEVTVTEEDIPVIADWFNRTVSDFEVDFNVEWKVYAGA